MYFPSSHFLTLLLKHQRSTSAIISENSAWNMVKQQIAVVHRLLLMYGLGRQISETLNVKPYANINSRSAFDSEPLSVRWPEAIGVRGALYG